MAGKRTPKRNTDPAQPSTAPKPGLLRAAIAARPQGPPKCMTCKLGDVIRGEIDQLLREGVAMATICDGLQRAYSITLGVTTLNNHKRARHHER